MEQNEFFKEQYTQVHEQRKHLQKLITKKEETNLVSAKAKISMDKKSKRKNMKHD